MTRKPVFLGLLLIVVLGVFALFANGSGSARKGAADSSASVLNQEQQAPLPESLGPDPELQRTDLREFFRDLAGGDPELRSIIDAEIAKPKWDEAQKVLLYTLFHGTHNPGETWITLGIDRPDEPDYGETWGP